MDSSLQAQASQLAQHSQRLHDATSDLHRLGCAVLGVGWAADASAGAPEAPDEAGQGGYGAGGEAPLAGRLGALERWQQEAGCQLDGKAGSSEWHVPPPPPSSRPSVALHRHPSSLLLPLCLPALFHPCHPPFTPRPA